MPHNPADRRVAVVSGASAGIGAATARALADLGHAVALGARRGERCVEVAEKICADGGEAIGLPLDVGDDGSVIRFAEAVREQLGAPDIVVSNAGGVAVRSAAAATSDEMRYDLEVNVVGAHRLYRAFVPAMLEQQRGDFVFISSDTVQWPRPGVAGYVAGKFGLEGLAAAIRTELEGTGVRASVVRPGGTISDIANEWDPTDFGDLYARWQYFGVQRHLRLLKPRHIASAVTTIISAPPGMHLALIEVQPEAPLA